MEQGDKLDQETAETEVVDELAYSETEMLSENIPPGVPQMTEEELEIFSGSLQPAQREQQRLEKKPDISHFELGIVYDEASKVYTPLFEVGTKIVAERFAECLPGNPWLDTRVYTVLSIDDPTQGVVHCFEDEVKHHAYLGYSHPFTVIRLWTPPKRGKNPFKAHKMPTEIFAGDNHITPGQTTENVTVGGVKRRGRKPGTKNRSRVEIIAERASRDAERAEKRAARALKKKKRG